jgi:transcriptional regulator with XRE-family HTH domain
MITEMVGTWLRRRRVMADLTQGQLVRHLQVTTGDVAAAEEGRGAFSGRLLWYWLRAAWLTTHPPDPLMEKLEGQIAELVAEAPEFAELLAIVREVNKGNPEKLAEVVRFTRWLLAEKETKREHRTE